MRSMESSARDGGRATKGTEATWEAMRARGWRPCDVARQLGCHSGLVCRWLHGQRIPRVEWAEKIERLLGVDVRLWAVRLNRPIRAHLMKPIKRAA